MKRKTLDALYNINKHSKTYAKRATEYYNKNKGATAKTNSLRKKALYSVKSEILNKIKDESVKVEIHRLNSKKYKFYCLYFEDEEQQQWSFHIPEEDIHIDSKKIKRTEDIDDFDKTTEKEHSKLTLKDSLIHIQKKFNINANEYLENKYVSYGYRSYFVGWKYLNGKKEVKDEI